MKKITKHNNSFMQLVTLYEELKVFSRQTSRDPNINDLSGLALWLAIQIKKRLEEINKGE